jgi:hypothetical protein
MAREEWLCPRPVARPGGGRRVTPSSTAEPGPSAPETLGEIEVAEEAPVGEGDLAAVRGQHDVDQCALRRSGRKLYSQRR